MNWLKKAFRAHLRRFLFLGPLYKYVFSRFLPLILFSSMLVPFNSFAQVLSTTNISVSQSEVWKPSAQNTCGYFIFYIWKCRFLSHTQNYWNLSLSLRLQSINKLLSLFLSMLTFENLCYVLPKVKPLSSPTLEYVLFIGYLHLSLPLALPTQKTHTKFIICLTIIP